MSKHRPRQDKHPQREKEDLGFDQGMAQTWASCGMPLLLEIIEATPAGMFLTDREGTILAINPGFTEMTGYAAAQAVGKPASLLKSGRHDAEFYRRFWRELQTNGRWQGQFWNRRRRGAVVPQWVQISALRDDHGTIDHYVAICSDMRKIKLGDNKIVHLAYHDALTGLPNRLLFDDRLRRTLLRAERSGTGVAVAFVDLDDFKPINDAHGHAVGDSFLRHVADRLREATRKSDTTARFGGDEFAIVLDGFHEPPAIGERISRIHAHLTGPIDVAGHTLAVKASIGVAVGGGPGSNAAALLAEADAAMYRAKARGKNQVEFFSAT